MLLKPKCIDTRLSPFLLDFYRLPLPLSGNFIFSRILNDRGWRKKRRGGEREIQSLLNVVEHGIRKEFFSLTGLVYRIGFQLDIILRKLFDFILNGSLCEVKFGYYK